ncbi:hypothetical protein J5W80_12110 [Akkermansia muciniphila]|uniref:thiamine pyrophosphate-binding protein n=1 Tax=Akkermansia muciniphila TaxID=239935 RepID=UPI001C06011B|nr:thiamine pyrophosphate-binding protein [Akkermansia muciniphila]QWP29152.1 hypothetical protein J5W80_12110 [Akkermansia muciniphila]
MNSPASFVKSLLAQCCLGGICEWVVCPGARNVALLQVLAAAEDLVKWTHFDERSAAFFALGRIQDMGLPVAVVTTSGTAAAELLPAVVEAYYQRRPLLLLTADRPAACRGSAAPQAIEQVDLFGIYAPTIDLETPESLPEDILQDWDYASPPPHQRVPAGPGPCLEPRHLRPLPGGASGGKRIPGFPGGAGPGPALQIARRAGSHDRRPGPHGTGPGPVAGQRTESPRGGGRHLRAPGRAGPSGPDGRGRPAEGTSARRPA